MSIAGSGRFRHRVTFTKPSEPSDSTQNTYGEDAITNEHVGTFWCRIEPLAGREMAAVQQKFAEARYKITMRHQPSTVFTRKMQAWWGSPARILDILDVQDVAESMRPEITMLAKDYEG